MRELLDLQEHWSEISAAVYSLCADDTDNNRANNFLQMLEDLSEDQDEQIEELKQKNCVLKDYLRRAVNELDERLNDLCATTPFDSDYSPCSICLHDGKCTNEDTKVAEWLYHSITDKLLLE